jgi:TRAP transporter TAXI family solute receptor
VVIAVPVKSLAQFRTLRLAIAMVGIALALPAMAAAPGMAAAAGAPMALVIRAGAPEGADNRHALELARALAATPAAGVTLSVEASEGSRQNIIEAPLRGPRVLFTAVPRMVEAAANGESGFAADPHYGDIRALFPLPFPAIHWVVRADSGVGGFADLAGRPFLSGRPGSLAADETAAAFRLLGLAGKVKLIDSGSPLAMLSSDAAVGFAEAGAVPDRGIARLAESVPVRLLSLGRDDLDRMLAADDSLAAMVIPAHTYPGVDGDVLTVARPAGVYATTALSDEDAYRLTRAFWQAKPALEAGDPAWAAVTPETLVALAVKLHPGALRYYSEAGMPVPPGRR